MPTRHTAPITHPQPRGKPDNPFGLSDSDNFAVKSGLVAMVCLRVLIVGYAPFKKSYPLDRLLIILVSNFCLSMFAHIASVHFNRKTRSMQHCSTLVFITQKPKGHSI